MRSRVTVAGINQGDGIAPVHLKRIFNRLYRIDAARACLSWGSDLLLQLRGGSSPMSSVEAPT